MASDKRASRRRYSKEIKAGVTAECDAVRASVAKVAMLHGMAGHWRCVAAGAGAATAARRCATGGACGARPADGPGGAGRCGCAGSHSAGTAPTRSSWPRSRVRPWRASAVRSSAWSGRCPTARRRDARTAHVGKPTRPPRAALAGSPLFCIDLLEHGDVQITLGQQFLQPRVLRFQRAQPLDVRRRKFAEVLKC